MNAALVYLGVTHKTAPVAVRERYRPNTEQHRALVKTLAASTRECALLNTCARVEIYAAATRPDPTRWFNHVTNALALPHTALPPHVRVLTGEACAHHLLRVAAGLESQVIGETHILHQVRQAFQFANAFHPPGPILSALFRAAIHTGRRVRREPLSADLRQSPADLAVDRVAAHCRRPNPTIVVVGSGRIAAETVNALRRRTAHVVIANRSIDHARILASKVRGHAAGLDALPAILRHADAAIVCTAAPTYIIDANTLGGDLQRDLMLVDLAVPRNVHPSVARIPGVRLIHLDQLARDRSPSADAVAGAEAIVQDQLERFLRWRRARVVAPQIRSLLRTADSRHPNVRRRRKRALHRPIAALVESAAA